MEARSNYSFPMNRPSFSGRLNPTRTTRYICIFLEREDFGVITHRFSFVLYVSWWRREKGGGGRDGTGSARGGTRKVCRLPANGSGGFLSLLYIIVFIISSYRYKICTYHSASILYACFVV